MASATSTTSPDPSGSQPASSSPSAATGAAVRDRVQGVINLIRPAVQADGGDIELVDVTGDGTVQIRFHGACHGCPSSSMTLHQGIERNLREKIPEVTRVVAVP
jgi:Fe-S cluster biogenesis protein NfuA